MSASLSFAYCQPRLQARLAALPREEDWGRLSGVRGLGAFVEDARTGPLRVWLKGFSAQSGCHDLDRGVRALVWDLTREVAEWVPDAWRAAVEWVGWIPRLPLFEAAARGEALPDWVGEDARLRPLWDARGLDSQALVQAGVETLLVSGEPERVVGAWADVWRRRCPPVGRETRASLDRLARLLHAHLRTFRQAAPADAWTLRQALGERLRLLFHCSAVGPVPVFAYLALLLIQLERLRAELLRRSLGLPLDSHASRVDSAPAPSRGGPESMRSAA